MAYTYRPGSDTDVDNVRLLVPDIPDTTKTPQAIFQDAEITRLVALEGDIRSAAALACEIIATKKSSDAIMQRLADDFQVDKRSVPGLFLKRAERLRSELDSEPVEEIDSFSYEVDEFGEDKSKFVGDD